MARQTPPQNSSFLPQVRHEPFTQPPVPLHTVPSGALATPQRPVVLLHPAETLQTSVTGGQVTGLPPVQIPAWQVSPVVQPLPSEQAAPFDLTGFEQSPVDGEQVPALWHWSSALHVTGFVPTQEPLWQTWSPKHLLPSPLQDSPSRAASQVPVAALQTVHSPQLTGVPATQLPSPSQISSPLQALLSLQAVPAGFGISTQPGPGWQLAVIQGFVVVHSSGVPLVQAPPWHVSKPLQGVPSLQEVPSGTAGFEQRPVPGLQTPAVWQRSGG